MKLITLILVTLFTQMAFAGPKVAMVKLVRGDVDVLTLGKTTPLKVDDWVENGSVIKTHEKSFVKLIFVDKSQMNVGPNSEMKIESFSGKDSGVIDLVKGKIRSQVTKDYLQINKDKSKLFIKTQNAVMGVRGTDFMISTNGINTSTVLFEGEIVFNKLEQRGRISSENLERIVDQGIRIYPGEFSVMEVNRPMPTVPALLNVQQREQLEKNQNFDTDRTPSNAQTEPAKSVVPAGLNGQQVSNDAGTLKDQVAQIALAAEPGKQSASSANPDGFVKGNLVKPANGSFVHIESGVIIPPGPGSLLDSNTNTYIPGQDAGRVASNGDYIPPKNMEITDKGEFLVRKTDPSGTPIVEKLPPTTVAPSEPVPTPVISDIPLPTSGTNTVDTRFAPTAGFTGSNDPTRAISTSSDVTIRAKPTP